MESGILSAIGQTPSIRVEKLYPKVPFSIFAKLEMMNPGGSIKDRPAFLMLSKALDEGKITDETMIIESSSGNMAIGLAQVCRYLGLNLIIVVDPKINAHTLKILQAYGVSVEKVKQTDEDGNYLNRRLERVQELLDQVPNAYWPNQYANENNPAAHYITMKEIAAALPNPPDYLFASTSTCGTIMGCADYIKENKLNTKIVAVDAVGSVIFGSSPKNRLVPGHGAGRPSQLLEKSLIDHVVHINDRECVTGCHRLLDREGILAGGSSGAVVVAIEKMSRSIEEDATCAIILPDSGERYLDTIYSEKWISKNFNDSDAITSPNYVNGFSKKSTSVADAESRNKATQKIAIIGGGPKGMYGFERLAAQFKAHTRESSVEIHIFNRNSHFGSGEIYRPNQPAYLLTNNSISNINMWVDEKPPAVVENRLNLREWLRRKSREESDDYVSRGVVGEYLSEGFQRIAQNLPADVTADYLVGEVTDVNAEHEKYILTLKTSDCSERPLKERYDDILLATGHPRNKLTNQQKKLKKFADERENLSFTSFIYPVEKKLNAIPAHSEVAIKGIGLTFIDAVLALTEGRGGAFEFIDGTNRLKYRSSGNEPSVVYPFSRSGLPMIPRKPAPNNEPTLKFFIESAVAKIAEQQGKLDFKQDLLPLLRREMIFAYYDIRFKQTAFQANLTDCETFAEMQHYINAFHQKNNNEKRFDPVEFLNPLQEKKFVSAKKFHQYIRFYLEFFVNEADKGETESPWAAVTAVWRKATTVFAGFYEFGGLTPGSQQFFDEIFRSKLNRVTFGPPIQTVKKMLALMEAGFLNFEMAQNPAVKINQIDGIFMLESTQNGSKKTVHHVVDARISNVLLSDDRAPLYKNILRRGLITRFENEWRGESYHPGCMAISPEGFAKNETGEINCSIAVTGTPTEGITFDNDTLSRHRNNFVSRWAASVRKKYQKNAAPDYVSG